MNEEQEFENYLSISPNKFGIYSFDRKNLKNLYKEEIPIDESLNLNNLNTLNKFLDNNIFKIEKLSGKFIKNISVILEDEKIFNLYLGIKRKNYNIFITKEYLESLLAEAKELFRENNQNENIMHMIIKKYFVNGKSYSSFEENLKSDHLALEIQFKSISNTVVYELNKILENYHIKIDKYLDGRYVKNFFDNEKELSVMSHMILNGYNKNEVNFVTKNLKKSGFFEKFFQLFS